MQPDKKIKTVKIFFEQDKAYSKTSSQPVPNLLPNNEFTKSSDAYGILFHEEQFIFGRTNTIYDKQISGEAGFLISLENYRLSDFYESDY